MKSIISCIKKNWKDIVSYIVIIVFITFTYTCTYNNGYDTGIKSSTPNIIYIDNVDTIPTCIFKSPKEGLKEALTYYRVEHADIVYAQAVLETGNFTSNLCKDNNNLFGLYNSKSKKFFRFTHWTEAIEAYKNYIQCKYHGGDYYKFLENLGYATDSEYINKLKEIINSNK